MLNTNAGQLLLGQSSGGKRGAVDLVRRGRYRRSGFRAGPPRPARRRPAVWI